MQINEYDFRKIRQMMDDLDKRITNLEESVKSLQKGLEDYDKSYGQSITEWLESLDASKQKDPEE